MREGLRLLEQREQEERVKLSWLRGAAREGFEQIARGESIELRTAVELDQYIDRLGKAASAEVGAKKRG